MTHPLFRLLLDDTKIILRPPLITESESPHHNLLLVLSDLHSFVAPFEQVKLSRVQLKLQFYAAHVLSEDIFPPDGARYVVDELDSEARRHPDDGNHTAGYSELN